MKVSLHKTIMKIGNKTRIARYLIIEPNVITKITTKQFKEISKHSEVKITEYTYR